MKAAVIGAGQIARQHLACLKQLPGVDVVGICDLSRGAAECAAERFGVPRWFTKYQAMFEETKPDVVHIATPPTSHFPLAMDAMKAGAHVFLEKPATVTYEHLAALRDEAKARQRVLIEDYNYVFNKPIRRVLDLVRTGEFGEVTHVEVVLCLNILEKGNRFSDPNAPHPCLTMAGGAIADFLPHLASLAYFFVGPHRSAQTVWSKRSQSPLPSDEFRALVDAERGTATLVFSANTQPDVFWVRVYATKMRATVNLFESRLTIDRVRGGARPLNPFLNGLEEAERIRRATWGSLFRKFSAGPGAYEGLFELVGRTYASLAVGGPPPISLQQVDDVNRLVADLKPRQEAHA